MVGAMIESRLGLTAMAHVVAVLGGADWVDLDTAFLLAHDPCMGGMRAEGPLLSLPSTPGLGIELRDRPAA
jgi:L-alanine-DL-glutamate epimerase-like enolase superfamily enzyme